MEELLYRIFSENWIIVSLFIVMMYWMYKLLKYFVTNYLQQLKKHNQDFIIELSSIVKGTSEHSEEHKILMSLWSETLKILTNLHVIIKDLHLSIEDCQESKNLIK